MIRNPYLLQEYSLQEPPDDGIQTEMVPSHTPPLLRCPTDVLALILQWLSSHDLHALCLVCRDLHHIAEPVLYSNIHLTWVNGHDPRITSLLGAILTRPDLAACVRRILLDGDTFYNPPRSEEHTFPISEADLIQPMEFVKRYRVPSPDIWVEQLRAGDMGAFLAILLSQLHNIEYLDIRPNFARNTHFLGIVLRAALCEASDHGFSTFLRLREVRFDLKCATAIPGRQARNTQDLLPFFYLPSVERISVAIENPERGKKKALVWPGRHEPVVANLTHLDVTIMKEGHLGRLLSATPALKTLRWVWVYHLRDSVHRAFAWSTTLNLDQVAKDLSLVRDTLTDLTIRAEAADGRRLRVAGSLRAMVGVGALRRFEVPWAFLCSYGDPVDFLPGVLPSNIESLTINDDLYNIPDLYWGDDVIFKSLRFWLQDWISSTPHIKLFHLLLRETSADWQQPLRDKLAALGVSAGLKLEITKIKSDVLL